MRSYTHRVGYDLTGRRALTLAQELARIPLAELDALILSLDDVDAIDASGLAVLVRLYSHLTRSRKFLVLKGFQPEVESILRRVGLESVLVDAEEPSALGDSKRHKPWTPADSRLPSRSQRGERPAQAKREPSIDDVVDALASLDTSQAMSFLSKVQNRLGLTPPEPVPAIPAAAQSAPQQRQVEPPQPQSDARTMFSRQGQESHQFSVVQGEILRTGKRRNTSLDSQGICEPARSNSGSQLVVDPTDEFTVTDPAPSESLPDDVEDLLLDYLGHDQRRKAKRRRAKAAHSGSRVAAASPTMAATPGPSATAPGPPVPGTPKPRSTRTTAEQEAERKRREALPAGVRAILSDYLSHEDSTTLGPWANASGIG